MIILLYFDWVGGLSELKDLNEKIKKSCEDEKVKYMGIYGPLNLKWNYVWIFEVESYEDFIRMAHNIHRHPKMPHHIAEILIPQNI
ncbi:hypothetical protein KEJ21_00565 [Candidatus Bathyarchaeota archaeon]|nr:hypothetical protein [Candidatus Bathyarchaeota archaeon]MBS7631169.1 hypothetical protein [Candidatus Bathyarchaeota archaeon]